MEDATLVWWRCGPVLRGAGRDFLPSVAASSRAASAQGHVRSKVGRAPTAVALPGLGFDSASFFLSGCNCFFFLKKSTQDNQQAMTFSVLSEYIRCANLLWQGKHSKENRGVQKTKGKDDFWKKIWSIDCPPKIKHFLWRLSHNTLAVTRVLKKRGMKLDTRCCLCGTLDENGGHHLLLK